MTADGNQSDSLQFDLKSSSTTSETQLTTFHPRAMHFIATDIVTRCGV